MKILNLNLQNFKGFRTNRKFTARLFRVTVKKKDTKTQET